MQKQGVIQIVKPLRISNIQNISEKIKQNILNFNKFYQTNPYKSQTQTNQVSKQLQLLNKIEQQPKYEIISVQTKETNDMNVQDIEKAMDKIQETFDYHEQDEIPTFIYTRKQSNDTLVKSGQILNNFHIQQYIQTKAENLESQVAQQYALHQCIPQNMDIQADQYVQIGDELLKSSMFIYEKLNYSNIHKITPNYSQIRLFMNNITYPQSQLFVIVEPRNMFNDLPGLQSENAFETKEQYYTHISQQLLSIGKQIENEISAIVTYGNPIYRQPDQIVFELYEQIYTNTDLPYFINSIKNKLLVNKQILYVSKKDIDTFMLQKSQTNDNVSMYDNFLTQHQRLQIMQQNEQFYSYISSQQHLKLYAQLAGQKFIEDGMTNYYSSDLKIISSHLLAVDNAQTYDDPRSVKQLTLEKMFSVPKDAKSTIQTGLVDTKSLQSENEQFSRKLIQNGAYMQVNDNQFISNMIIDPVIEYKYTEGQNNVTLPTVMLKFRNLISSFNFGSANIVPRLQQISSSQDQKLWFSGTVVSYDQSKNISPEALPLILNFPFKILSHCSIKIHNLTGDLKLGFQLENTQLYKVNLQNGSQEIPPDYKLKNFNFGITKYQLFQLQESDILILNYFISVCKPLKQELHIKLLRDQKVFDVLSIEVPNECAQTCIWMSDKQDCISIIQGKMNSMSATDQQPQKKIKQ